MFHPDKPHQAALQHKLEGQKEMKGTAESLDENWLISGSAHPGKTDSSSAERFSIKSQLGPNIPAILLNAFLLRDTVPL